jgi:L-glyceraldehyde 3-phosphate reductase
MGALDYAVRSGKARYVGISSYSPQRTSKAVEILAGSARRC